MIHDYITYMLVIAMCFSPVILALLLAHIISFFSKAPFVQYSITGEYASVYIYWTLSKETDHSIHDFSRKENGGWKYDSDFSDLRKRGILFVTCFIGSLLFFMFFWEEPLPDLLTILTGALFWGVLCFGTLFTDILEAYVILQLDLKKKMLGDEVVRRKEKKNYDVFYTLIKAVVRTTLFLLWLGVFSVFLISFAVLVYELISLVSGKRLYLLFCAMTVFGLLVIGVFMYFWIRILKPLMGDRSFTIPLNRAGGAKRYAPKMVLQRLSENRNNVILIKDKGAMIRIYGNEYGKVVEILIGSKDDLRTYHLIETDPQNDTTVEPVSHDIVSIVNKWLETIPVRTNWLVSEEIIVSFLQKLYDYKDLTATLMGYYTENTTEETKKLIAADAYIVPEIPVALSPFLLPGILRTQWVERSSKRFEKAVEIMSQQKTDQ